MATQISFKNAAAANISKTAEQKIYTAGQNLQSGVVFFLNVSNKSTAAEYVDISILNNADQRKSYVTKEVIIPVGASLQLPIKIPLAPNESIAAKSKISATSLDITVSILEMTVA